VGGGKEFPIKVDGSEFMVSEGERSSSHVDVRILRDMVTDEDFMECISAPIGKVRSVLGDAMAHKMVVQDDPCMTILFNKIKNT
jgi:hypothetical protein